MASEDGKVVIRTTLDNSEFNKGILDIGNVAKRGLSSLKGLLAGVGLATTITASIAAIAKSTTALEASMAKASTLYGEVEVDTGRLRGQMLGLSSDVGVTASSIGNSLYNALSAGIPVTEDMAESMGFMTKNAKLAKAGFTDIDTALTTTAKTLNAYKLGVDQTDRIHKVLMQTQNRGITTVGELGSVLAQVTPTAAAFGVEFEQVGTAIALMTKQGTPAAQATTQLNQMISELGKNGTIASENLKQAARSAGIGQESFKDMIASGMNLGDILQLMANYAEQNNLSMIDMFSSIDAGKGAVSLSGKNFEEFISILQSMFTKTDVVGNAYNKVMNSMDEQTKRLKIAVENAGTALGTKFAPSATQVIKGLADIISRFSDTSTASSKLSGKFSELTAANANYKTTVDNAKTSQEGLTQAMKDAAAVALRQKFAALAGTYQDTLKELSSLKTAMEVGNASIADQETALMRVGYALGLSGNNAEEMREQFRQMYAAGDISERMGSSFLRTAAALDKTTTEVQGYTSQYEKSSQAIVTFVGDMAKAYLDGDDSIALFKYSNEALYNDVMKVAAGLKVVRDAEAEAEAIFKSLTITTKAQADEAVRAYETALSYAKGEAEKAKYTKLLNLALAEQAKFQVTATESTEEDTKAKKDNNKAVEDTSKTVYDLNKTYSDTADKLKAVEDRNRLLGGTVDTTAEKQAILESAIKDMLENGVDPANEKLQILIARLKGVKSGSTDSKKEIKTLADAFADLGEVAEDAAKAAVKNFLASFASIGEMLATKEDRLAEADENRASALEELSEAQEALNKATASGDADSIDKAQKIYNAKQKLLKAAQAEYDAVKSGSDVWKELGKNSLLSIASTVEALGHELAARAVVALFSPSTWGVAALAGAASASAYVAAGMIKGWANSFSVGGIVPEQSGVSTTGDQTVVYANPGEVILNAAQQTNVAKQLEALAKINELVGHSSGGSLSIGVAFNGPVFGDQETISRYVYDGIKRAQWEGVLKQW